MTLKRYSSVIFFASLLFFVITISSCKTSLPASDQNNEPLISIATTGCFGRCPIYKISVYPNRYIVYEGIRFTEQTGRFCSILNKSEFSDIENILTKANLPGMNDTYPGPDKNVPTDLPSTIIKYHKNGARKTITDYDNQGPQMLLSIEKKLNALVKNGKLQSCDK